MDPILIPSAPNLADEAAVNALNDYIHELESLNDPVLTEKQLNAMIKFARGLRSSIQAETASDTFDPSRIAAPVTSWLKQTVWKRVTTLVNSSMKIPSPFQTMLQQQGYSRKATAEIWKWYDDSETKGVASW